MEPEMEMQVDVDVDRGGVIISKELITSLIDVLYGMNSFIACLLLG
jgi:hypothetical protein